jgi:hypothetical protein
MELDREMQRRVWDRVQGREPVQMPSLKPGSLKPLLYPAQENSAVYQSLSHRLQGKDGEKCRRLHQESQKWIACIKGMCRLQGEAIKVPQLTAPKEPTRRALEKCYHREKHLWTEYENRSADPEHGVVFGRLAQQAREHCVTILEILGELEK